MVLSLKSLVAHVIRVTVAGFALLPFFAVFIGDQAIIFKVVDPVIGSSYLPFVFATLFAVLAFSSVCFWHAALWSIIVPKQQYVTAKPRLLFLKAIDYVWYGSAIVVALLAINDLQRKEMGQYLEGIDGRISNHAESDDRLVSQAIRACETLQSTTYFPTEERGIDEFKNAQYLCDEYILGVELLIGDFIDVCEERGFRLYRSNDPAFWPDDPHPRKIAGALEDIGYLCLVHYEWNKELEIQSELKRYVREIGWLPPPETQYWFFLITLIVGLRLSKTSAEFADAWRK